MNITKKDNTKKRMKILFRISFIPFIAEHAADRIVHKFVCSQLLVRSQLLKLRLTYLSLILT
jgi:hypothetical protein